MIRTRLPAVREGISILDPKRRTEEEQIEAFEKRRVPYSAMQAHREMAAQVLAVGGTFKMASMRAGVSMRQIRKYYGEADFRSRIDELRSTMLSKVRGRVMAELSRRTDASSIKRIELLDLLRIYDRVATTNGRGHQGVTIAGDVNVNQYDTIIQALLSSNPSSESSNFPLVELEGSALPGEDSPV